MSTHDFYPDDRAPGAKQWVALGLALVILGAGGAVGLRQVASRQQAAFERASSGPLGQAKLNEAQARAAYARVPLGFEANQGQSAAAVRFLAQAPGYRLFLTATEAVLDLAPSRPQGEGAVLRLSAVGGNPSPAVIGEQGLAAKVNYLSGSDPQGWHTDVPTFGRVAVRDVYPGIDMAYYGNHQQLEYDFIVAPGADPALIRLGIKGARSVTVDGHGDLVLDTAAGSLVQHRPVAYQQEGDLRRPVSAEYVVSGQDEVGLRLGPYDTGRPLVVDPVISYSTYLGGKSQELGEAIAVDAAGSAYVTGSTQSTDFPTEGAIDGTLGPGVPNARVLQNSFVSKLDPTGSSLVYSTYLGGKGIDGGTAIAVDQAGQAYVGGHTNSTDFPTVNAFQPAYTSPFSQNCSHRCYSRNGFVAKLNASGSALVYSTYLGGTNGTSVRALAIDEPGNAYVAGSTDSHDFPTTPGAFQGTYHGHPNPCCGNGPHSTADAFVTKLSPAGSVVYSTFLGGSCNAGPENFCTSDQANGITVDASGHAFVVGTAGSLDFPTTAGAFNNARGLTQAFVVKLNPAGSAPVYSALLGGSHFDDARDVAVNAAGEAFVAGLTGSEDFPVTPPFAGSFGRAFVTKISSSGSDLVFSNLLGGWGQQISIAVDGDGASYVALAADFAPTLAKLGSDGWVVIYKELPTRGVLTSIALDRARNVYTTGYTSAADFPTTADAYDRTLNPPDDPRHSARTDAVVVKVNLTTPSSKDDCKAGMWQNQAPPGGSRFTNQGACISYVMRSAGG